MPARKVLVTGEQGFLGAHLTEQLRADGAVYNFSGDITDRQFCFTKFKEVQPDVIVHLAALSLPKQCDEDPQLARAVNIEGTQNIVDAVRSLDKKVHFIFTSTAQVYDYAELSKGLPVDESCKINPQNFYAETKYACEQLLETEGRGKMNITILRLFNHVHKSQQSATFMSSVFSQINNYLSKGASRGTIMTGDLELYRELNPVQSLLELLISLCKLDVKYGHEVFNVCSGNSRKLKDVAEAFAQYMEFEPEFVCDPTLIRKNDPKKFVGSNKKIKDVLHLAYPNLTNLELVKYFCSEI